METEVSEMIAEVRINGKPVEPKIIKETENSLSCKGTMVTATILSTTNYFRLPNDIFNLDLCAEEIAVYAFILRMENRRTYTCFPSYKTIGRALKMSKNTVAKYVHSLADKRLIELEQTSFTDKNGNKRNGNLNYKVLPISVAMQEFYDRQLVNNGLKDS
jgi:predicted transcriptional regulator